MNEALFSDVNFQRQASTHADDRIAEETRNVSGPRTSPGLARPTKGERERDDWTDGRLSTSKFLSTLRPLNESNKTVPQRGWYSSVVCNKMSPEQQRIHPRSVRTRRHSTEPEISHSHFIHPIKLITINYIDSPTKHHFSQWNVETCVSLPIKSRTDTAKIDSPRAFRCADYLEAVVANSQNCNRDSIYSTCTITQLSAVYAGNLSNQMGSMKRCRIRQAAYISILCYGKQPFRYKFSTKLIFRLLLTWETKRWTICAIREFHFVTHKKPNGFRFLAPPTTSTKKISVEEPTCGDDFGVLGIGP